MTEHRGKTTSEPIDGPETFADFVMVRLERPVHGFDVLYPAGNVGTIVHRDEDGIGYEVEFVSPEPGVATVVRDDLESA
jgi:hypothetical protein